MFEKIKIKTADKVCEDFLEIYIINIFQDMNNKLTDIKI